ncbi:hypothetical protein K2173_023257 [Erythroxylum novogranatense]|uniref:Chlororespiratory reduction 4 n=1 Tax=Erythroxylum novogranatense TaxID=1862640 RepID=A0AAV8T8S1_9ROSI|nr:hypothetical protein K2173_023257 [Erythroxylum novogranatense]
MVLCSCPVNATQTSISKFITDQPYLSMLEKSCTNMKDLKKIHTQLIKTGLAQDPIAASRVLAFCTSQAGDMSYACLVFAHLPCPNLFAWNSIIRGFCQSSTPQYAISLFNHMLLTSQIQPQSLTYPSVFKAYAQLGLATEGVQLHARVIKFGLQNDQFIRNTILHMYANSGFLSEAKRVFNGAVEFDVITWNTMIMGLAKNGKVDESRRIFDHMPSRTEVSWNSMISGYVRNGRFIEALEFFGVMQQEKIKPTEFTMVSLLNACGCLGAIRQGKWIHEYLVIQNFELNPIVVTAIVDMYSKCGYIDKALQVFNSAPKKALSCWNSMIFGLAMNGHDNEAIQLISTLKSSSSFKPDAVSFIGALTACKHLGLVDRAKDYFLLMTETYKIKPSIKHYSCMVDALGQAGLLEEAEELIQSMPIVPDAVIWGSLLSSCRKYGHIEIANRAAKHVNEMDPKESSSPVLMSNVYAASGHYAKALRQRLSLKENNIEKEPGCSLIEVDGNVHEFVASGRLHPRAKDIYHILDILEF